MAQQLAPRSVAPSVCSEPLYAPFLCLRNFAPAVTFCSVYLAESTLPSTSSCPNGNALCSVLSTLSKCERSFISTVCSCIESGSTTTISVPKSTTLSTTKTTAKTTAKSSSSTKPISQSSSAKSTLTALATSQTSSVPTPTFPAPVLSPTCTQVFTPDQANYFEYYSGQYFIENTDNNGNNDLPDYPPVTTEYPGTLDMCDVAQLCADNAEATPGNYQSFDLHYLSSTGMWECVQYYDPNNDASYFNVPDQDALYVFGFASCC